MTKNQRAAAEAVDAVRDEMVALADAVHANPEEALKETVSAGLCADVLRKHGFAIEHPFPQMPTAFVATRGKGKPVVGLLAEYDALPNCGARGGPGHGCGHNLLGASAVAGGIAAANVLEKRGATGTVKVFGCPAEETLVGKCYMARDGAFDGLDACLAWHPGEITCADNTSWAANDSVVFEFRGLTAHAAGNPQDGRSALDGVEIMNVAVNFLREHVEENVRIHYCIREGGPVPNVVPGYARSWYMIRGRHRTQVEAVKKRVKDCARGAATATGTKVKSRVLAASYNHLVNQAIWQRLRATLEAFGGPGFTDADAAELRKMGFAGELSDAVSEPSGEWGRASTDEANVTWLAPTGRFTVACWGLGTRKHSVEIVKQARSSAAHKGMLLAGKVFASVTLDLATDGKTLKAARREFKRQTRDFTYDPIVPKSQRPPIRDQISK